MSDQGLVFIGKIIDLQPIPGADFIVSATVICGKGGKWMGVVRKADFELESECVVFLPDCLLNERDHDYLPFMKNSNWRVKMRRFKGAPSEVLITGTSRVEFKEIGDDVTNQLKVVKYDKPIPASLSGTINGHFPSFIPKTDELNYQSNPALVESLVGKPWYMTEKADGSSTTAYRYKGNFCICSRNYELARNEDNGYWKVAIKYKLEENLPEGIAVQWETCGPGIQSNPMGLKEIDGFMFSAYNITEKRYLDFKELLQLSDELSFPTVKIVGWGESFTKDGIETLGEGLYSSGNEREGVVVRSQNNHGYAPISFKVINLGFEK